MPTDDLTTHLLSGASALVFAWSHDTDPMQSVDKALTSLMNG